MFDEIGGLDEFEPDEPRCPRCDEIVPASWLEETDEGVCLSCADASEDMIGTDGGTEF